MAKTFAWSIQHGAICISLVEPDICKTYAHAIFLLCWTMFQLCYVHYCLCINYVTHQTTQSKVCKIYVETMFRLFEKHIAFEYLCKYYSKSFHSLDIAMYLLCNRKFCFSFRLASYVFTMHQSKIAFTQHFDLHFYFQQVSQLLHSAMYILCYVMKHICSLCIHYVTFSFSFIMR